MKNKSNSTVQGNQNITGNQAGGDMNITFENGNSSPEAHKTSDKEKKNHRAKKVLILTANPTGTDRLRQDKEIQVIQKSLQYSNQREEFEIQVRMAVGIDDIRKALLNFKPHIVHFSVHSREGCLLIEDEMGFAESLSPPVLAGLFKEFSEQVECVVIGACSSEPLAIAICQHIDFVIAMKKEIKDQAAVEFSKGFYDAIFSGFGIVVAFKIGRNSIQQKFPGMQEHLIPTLKRKL